MGTRFSQAFDFSIVTNEGKQEKIIMGCYGLGPSRVMGTIVEVHHDDKGMMWPEAVAPFQVHLVSLCRTEEHKQQAENLYKELLSKNIEVLFDDREGVSAGERFADSDLIGIPVRIVVSPRTLENASVEIKKRNEAEPQVVKISEVEKYLK